MRDRTSSAPKKIITPTTMSSHPTQHDAAREQRKKQFGYLIESDCHAARGKTEPPLHEAREEIAGDRCARDQCADLPWQSEQLRRERCSQQRKRNSANGFCRTERRASVGQDGSPVEWSVEARAERPFGEHGGAVGDDDQQDELGD